MVKIMELRIMTSNVWGDYFGNEVEFRDEQLLCIYQRYSPDVIGFQEMTPNWYKSPMLEKLSNEYTFVGTDLFSTQNYTPLVYKTDKYRIVEKGWKYLSDTPDDSKSITWVVLKDKKSQELFACCNTQ